MYKLLLILKYLRKRRIAWVALAAVTLCTAMVLIVISVMGGWLQQFRQSFHSMTGDVLVEARHPSGFAWYGDIADRLRDDPQKRIAAATPVIKTYGLMLIANSNQDTSAVQVIGIDPSQAGMVNRFPQSLHRQWELPRQEGRTPGPASFGLIEGIDYAANFRAAYPRAAPELADEARTWPGMIVGAGVIGIRRGPDGKVVGRSQLMYRLPVKLTVLGMPVGGGALDLANKSERNYWMVDDSRTKVWQYDTNTVYVPLEVLQLDLGMQAQRARLRDGRETEEPARVTELHVRLAPGVPLAEGRAIVHAAVRDIFREKGYSFSESIDDSRPDLAAGDPVRIRTWEQINAKWLGAIEKERILVLVLFGIISVVSVFLIFCIFYMIVQEKTRDIGIIKSVGATPGGVAGIFLGYGLALGVVGALLGLGLAYLIVGHINEIHSWLGRQLGVVVWDPEIYAFDEIPSAIDPVEAAVLLSVALVACVVGSLLPALRAASMNPVDSLRWE